jgi:hypothetical protein
MTGVGWRYECAKMPAINATTGLGCRFMVMSPSMRQSLRRIYIYSDSWNQAPVSALELHP